MPSCGARPKTFSARARRARSLSVPSRCRSVCTHAVEPSGTFSSVEAFRQQLKNTAESTPVSEIPTAELQSTVTDWASTAASRSKDVYTAALSAYSSSVEDLSSRFAAQVSSASDAATTISSDVIARSAEMRTVAEQKLSVLTEQLSSSADPDRFAGQLKEVSDKVVSIQSELSSKSSALSAQFTKAVDEQLANLPEIQSRVAASTDELLRNVNVVTSQASDVLSSDTFKGVAGKFEDNLDVFKGLVSSGQVADALATPEGIGAAAVAAAGVLFSVSSTVSSKNVTPTEPSSQTAAAISAGQETASGAESARAWIEHWRNSQKVEASGASLNGSAPSPQDALTQAAQNGASMNGMNGASLNGAAPPSGTFSGALNTYDSGAGDVLTEDAVATNGATPGSNGASGTLPTPVTDSEGNISDSSDDSNVSVVSEGETTADDSVASEADTASTTTAAAVAAENLIQIRYYSGWEAPTIHACAAGGEWTEHIMTRDDSGALTWQAEVAEGAQMEGGGVAEFVITDGAGDWDKSPTGENYRVPSVGVFELRDGALTEVVEDGMRELATAGSEQ